MSDAFKTWRKEQNPLRIGGPLDELLEKAFQAGRDALIEDIQASVRKSGIIAEEIERTIWISRDSKESLGEDPPQFRTKRPEIHTDGAVYYGHLDNSHEGVETDDQIARVPAAVRSLGKTIKHGELKRAVLIGGEWSLREADGA